jgi:transcription-repair coupling factor (superfamily II helicase)
MYVKKGLTYSRNKFLFKLVENLYSRSGNEFKRGTFRVKGDTVDLYLAYADYALRIEFWGDDIESICSIDPINNSRIESFDEINIFPANIFVSSPENTRTALEQIGEDGMAETAGPCTGADQRKACRYKKSLKTSYRHICLACEFRDRLIDPGKSALRCDKLGRGIKEVFNASLAMTGEISCAILPRAP